MGRGRKAQYAKKEARKEARAKAKGGGASEPAAKSKKKKQTAGSKKSIAKEKSGLIGGVSTIALDDADEKTILSMLLSFGSVAVPEDGDIEDAKDPNEPSTSVKFRELLNTGLSTNQTRKIYKRLIKCDRFECRLEEKHEKERKRQEKEAKRIEYMNRIAEEEENEYMALSSKPLASSATAESNQAISVMAASRSRSVRMHVSCESKGSTSKVIVVSRSAALAEVLQLCRNKFSVTKKFDCIIALPEHTLIDEDSLETIDEVCSVHLTSMSKHRLKSADKLEKESTIKNENHAPALPEEEKVGKMPAVLAEDAEQDASIGDDGDDGDGDDLLRCETLAMIDSFHADNSSADDEDGDSYMDGDDDDDYEGGDQYDDGCSDDFSGKESESNSEATERTANAGDEVGMSDDDDDSDDEGQNLPENSYWKPPARAAGGDVGYSPRRFDPALSQTMRRQQEELLRGYLQETVDEKASAMATTASPPGNEKAPGGGAYQAILRQRMSLPVYKMRQEILDAVHANQTIVISGETGSGKTTQLPAYLLEDCIARGRGSETFIICTQPRRIAAISVAERVAQERGERVGQAIGYQIRLESRCGPDTRILYVTTGVLLRKLQQGGFLSNVSHILVDEVHERQVETDFLITLLKREAHNYPDLKLVMMSATVQDHLFRAYFNSPVLFIKGRTFPVNTHFMEDCNQLIRAAQRSDKSTNNKKIDVDMDAVVDKLSLSDRKQQHDTASQRAGGGNPQSAAAADGKIKKPKFDAEIVAELVIRIVQTYGGQQVRQNAKQHDAARDDDEDVLAHEINARTRGDAVLVFLSGIQAIDRVDRALRRRLRGGMPNVEILTLHSSLQSHVQKRVFQPTKPGQWKIVLSTNIAETSVTVDDVTHVVDTGYHKEMCYDAEANMSSLQEVFVSRASAQQRAGRAGRVRAGHCWRLYSEEYFDNSEVVMAYPLPEIQRVPIEEVVLQVLLLELGLPNEFLSECPEPPSQAQVQTALVKLLTIKAILPLPNLPLTALGYHLAKLPVDVHVGKLLIMSSLLGCVEPALTIAAALGGKSPFSNPPNLLEEAYRAHCEFTNQYDENAPYTWTYQPPTNKKATYGKAARQKDDNDDANIYEAFFGGQTEALSASKKGGKKRDRDTQIQFSDHIAIVRAYNVWHDVSSKQGNAAAAQFCREKFLAQNVLQEIKALRENFRRHLVDAGFLQKPASKQPLDSQEDQDEEEEDANKKEYLDSFAGQKLGGKPSAASSSDERSPPAECASAVSMERLPMHLNNFALLRCALTAGLSPNVVRLVRVAGEGGTKVTKRRQSKIKDAPIRMLQADGKEVSVHMSSLAHRHVALLMDQQLDSYGYNDAFVVYHKKVASSKIFLHDCTAVPLLALLLFSTDLKMAKTRDRIAINGWVFGDIDELHSVLLKRVQSEIEQILREKVEDPHRDTSDRCQVIISVLNKLLQV